MRLPSKIKFADEMLAKSFEELAKGKYEDKKVYDWLLRAFYDLEENAFCGIQLPKKLIPRDYINKHNVHNLWKYNLPGAWRLLYSIESNQIVIVSIILEWMSHPEYERRFGYK